VSGYCEICQLTFVDQKRHLKSDRHTQFIGNTDNFLSLDKIISRGPTMESFLKLNGADQIRYLALCVSLYIDNSCCTKCKLAVKFEDLHLFKVLTAVFSKVKHDTQIFFLCIVDCYNPLC
jgi:hypothetical protein